MILAKELLSTRVHKRNEESSYVTVEDKLTFPMFQIFSDVFGVPLTPKTSKDQRSILKVTIEEAIVI